MTKTLKKEVLSTKEYRSLLGEVRRTIEEGKERAEEAVAFELVRTYHQVGRLILKQQLTGNAGYGTAVLQRLADDLGLNSRVLQNAVAFARAYREPPSTGLRWSHYRELLRLPSPEAREWYEQEAASNGWSRNKLVEAIRGQVYAKTKKKPAKPKAGESRAPSATLSRPRTATYVYKAAIERVVDGDTLLVVVDLGFQVLKRQRVRLAALDCPELGTVEGRRAAKLVEKVLAGVEFVMIKTEKIDLYGRYVAHVFFAAGEGDKERVFADGQYLNQLLVDQGVARALG